VITKEQIKWCAAICLSAITFSSLTVQNCSSQEMHSVDPIWFVDSNVLLTKNALSTKTIVRFKISSVEGDIPAHTTIRLSGSKNEAVFADGKKLLEFKPVGEAQTEEIEIPCSLKCKFALGTSEWMHVDAKNPKFIPWQAELEECEGYVTGRFSKKISENPPKACVVKVVIRVKGTEF